jgi:hypothetical protein
MLESALQELTMTTPNAPADASPIPGSTAGRAAVPAPPSWPWRRTALLLAGAAQLVTISALLGSDPIPAAWSSLLLAIAPALIAAAAAFAPAPVNRVAAVAGVLVLIAGMAGGIGRTGLLFIPALAVLAVAGARLWRE